ncbi:MAG: hypothetical protein ACRC6O_12260 [Flavobacterium sp.]
MNKNVLKITLIGLLVCFSFGQQSCTVHHVHPIKVVKVKKIPPGQAKKMTGEKSAKNQAHKH